MTAEQHNKYLGWSHLIHGGLFLIMVIFMLTMMGVMFSTMPTGPQGPPPALVPLMMVFMGSLYGLMLVPSLVAGYALLKRKPWARIAAIIGAVTAAMSFPIGSAVCAYTFWFMFSQPGRLLYDRASLPLTRTPELKDPEPRYIPPPTPPDWR